MNGMSMTLLAQQTAPDPRAGMLQLVGMFVIMGVMFYFAIWRPQQKKQKEHERLLKALKPGDKVITSGGICGVVVSIKERTVALRSADAKIEVLKSAVQNVVEQADSGSSS